MLRSHGGRILTPRTRIEIIIDNRTGAVSQGVTEGQIANVGLIGIYSQLITELAKMSLTAGMTPAPTEGQRNGEQVSDT